MDRKVLVAALLVVAFLAVGFAGCTGSEETPAAAGATEEKTYIVGIDGDYKPYSYIDEAGNPPGFDVDSIQWIADEMGFKVTVQPMAWDGIIPALCAGNIDMVYSGMTITEDRKKVVSFSDVYWVVNQSVTVRNGSEYTMDDFMNGTIIMGAQRGSTAAMWLEDNLVKTEILPEDNLKLYDNFPLAVTDLLNERIDGAMYDTPIVLDAIEGKPLKQLGEINTGEEYGIAVRQDDTELLETLNTGLNKLMDSPKWDELKEKYGM